VLVWEKGFTFGFDFIDFFGGDSSIDNFFEIVVLIEVNL